MGNTTAIRHTLQRIRASIGQEKLAQMASSTGVKPGDLGKQKFWQKLAHQETLLRQILRQLQGRQVSFEHGRTLLWRIPRESRYPARQSLDDREAVTLDLVELAEITLRELLDFSGDVASMKPGDWEKLGEQVAEAAIKVEKTLVHAVVQQMQKGPAFTAANAQPGLGLDHLAPLIGLLIAVIASKLRRTKPRD